MSSIETKQNEGSKILALRAIEVELTDGPDAALAVMGAPSDAVKMHAVLSILIRAGRFHVAADHIRSLDPHEKWAELAAYTWARIGDDASSLRCVAFADDLVDTLTSRRTRLAAAEGMIDRLSVAHSNRSLLAPNVWSPSDVDLAKTALELIDPIIVPVNATRRIQSEIEFEALIHAANCANITGNERLLAQCGESLLRYKPLPLTFAELCLRRMATCPKDLPERLRTEHPNDFQASFLASLIERDALRQPDAAFDALVNLSKSTVSHDEKDTLCSALFETAGQCEPVRFASAIEIVSILQPDNKRLVSLLQAGQFLSDNNLAQARLTLNEIRDETDGVWWQAFANLSAQEGDEDAAQKAWEKASELLPHPDVIRRSIQASLDQKRFESVIRGTKKLLADSPNNEKDLRALVLALTKVGDFPQAVEYLERLVTLKPENIEYRLSLAQSLGRSAQVKRAIDVLKPISSSDKPSFEVAMLASELHEYDGQPAEGFALLNKIADEHWDDPRFLMIYMHRGYAAGEEQLARRAFAKLVELRRSGNVPDGLMQEGTLEQLVEYGKDFHERRETLQRGVVGGRMPWLLADHILGHPAMWAWLSHTQDLRWLPEEPFSLATYTIYATNGFVVQKEQYLPRVAAPVPTAEVVADITALITLFQLGRLEDAADFCGRILLPAGYGDFRVRDASRFGLHQPSRESGLLAIRAAIDSGRIRIAEKEIPHLIAIDEYTDASDPDTYRLRDLIAPLRQTQRVASDAIDRLLEVAHKPETTSGGNPSIQPGGSIAFELSTLRTLAGTPLFDAVLNGFAVYVDSELRDEVAAELLGHRRAHEARDRHLALWDEVARLAESGKIVWQPAINEQEANSDEMSRTSIYFDAIQLAQDLSTSVLVDDRVLQVMFRQGNNNPTSTAFGTDRLLEAMLTKDTCDTKGLSRALLQLIRWRYRFLVPSGQLLFDWACDQINDLPGDALLDVAVYLHDCLRDSGLHCGMEATDPPIPMAAKLVTSWTDSIVNCLYKVWNDARFSIEQAERLTRWIAEELVPSSPRGLFLNQIGHNLAAAEVDGTLKMALVQFAAIKDLRRANHGIRVLAESLGLDNETLITAAAEVIDAIDR